MSARKNEGIRQVLPRESSPCVWMAAGLVAYKLCDREFRCEECAFDAAMRGAEASSSPVAAEPAVAASMEFPDDRGYDPSHAWAGAVGEDRIRVGLDAFAALLLRSVTGIILPAPGSTLTKGRVGCWVEDESVTVSLRSPVSGTVLRVNQRLRAHPALVANDPYGSGWLLEVTAVDPAGGLEGLLGAAEIRGRAQAGMAELRDVACAETRNRGERLGRTLADGGEPAADLRRILGPKRYHSVISRLLAG